MEMNRVGFGWKAWELLAVLFNLAYTWLYLQQNHWCFLFGILGPIFLFLISYKSKIYADAMLQLVYAILAIYGWWNVSAHWEAEVWTVNEHLLLLGASVLVWLGVWRILKFKTDGASPLVDSFCSVFAFSGTLLMINFVHENWLYFIAVNAVAALLYYKRCLYMASIMFLIYLVMSIDGYFLLGIFAS